VLRLIKNKIDHFKALFGKIQAQSEESSGWKEIWLEVIDAINGYFEEKEKPYYIKGMKSLSIIGTKCLSLRKIILKKNNFIL